MAIKLHPHQVTALNKIHNGSVLRGGVGVGKSITALAYYYQNVCQGSLTDVSGGVLGPMRTPKDVFVITTAKKRDDKDWEKEAAPFVISTTRDASMGGVLLKVDSWNNILNYQDVEGAFFIFDEQRLVGSGAWVKAFLKIAKNNKWIMLSATPGDVWLDYCPLFIANGFYKNKTEFLRSHVIFSRFSKYPKIEGYIGTATLEKYRRQITVDMPYVRHTRRNVRNIIVAHDKGLFDRVVRDRWHIYEDRPIRDVAELFSVMRKLVNSDVSRMGALMQLIEQHPKSIIFYNFDYELEILRSLASILSYPMAEWNGHKHQPIPEGDKWLYLVQYTAGAEGWNCITTDATIFYSLNYSWRINEQAKGRIDRLNTKYVELYYYYLRSNSMIDNAIIRSLSSKKDFNERSLIKPFKGPDDGKS